MTNPFPPKVSRNPFPQQAVNPFPKDEIGRGVGPVVPVGVSATDLARVDPITTALRVATLPPELRDMAQGAINRSRAPSEATTAADVALSRMLGMVSSGAADAAERGALERRAQSPEVSAFPSTPNLTAFGQPLERKETGVYRAAEHVGNALGTTAIGAGIGAGISPGGPALESVKTAAGVLRRLATAGLRSGATGAAVNAPLGFISGAAGGDEQGGPGLQAGLRQAGQGAIYGLGAGALFGIGGEGLGIALETRAARAGSPGSPGPRSPVLDAVAQAQRGLETPVEYRHAGIGIVPRTAQAIKNVYRSALVTPYADAEAAHPELVAALETAGAANQRALHIGSRRVDYVLEGLDPDQRVQFGQQLVHDNMTAEVERKGAQANKLVYQASAYNEQGDALMRQADASHADAQQFKAAAKAGSPLDKRLMQDRLDQAERMRGVANDLFGQRDALQAESVKLRDAATNLSGHALDLAGQLPAGGVSQEPWFQQALARHKQHVEAPLTQAALKAGVNPADLRSPTSAYVRLSSKSRLDDAAIRRAMEITGTKTPEELNRIVSTSKAAQLRNAIFGQDPELESLLQGPLSQAGGGYPGVVNPTRRTAKTGSANMTTGSAAAYETDYRRLIASDARDKVVKAARNDSFRALVQSGRILGQDDAPALGRKVISFDDKGNVAAGGNVRVEVTPEAANAFQRFTRHLEGEPTSAVGRAWGRIVGGFTQAQVSGMPVEATSHANSLASIVASVPGEKDIAGKVLSAIPGPGAKAAAIRDMATLDFSDDATRQLENRLADIGALRVAEPHSGLIHSSSNWLFGPGGVDTRARLVLARKYLARDPNASDDALREFITGKVGNYIPANSGALTNALQASGLSAFGRFQAARIPTSVKTTFGQSGLPAMSALQRAADIGNTLYRGPVGHLIGTNALNYALTGHSAFQNEPGHKLDVETGLSAVPGGIRKISPEEAQAQGNTAKPLYLPGATLNPVVTTGMRASGLRDLPPFTSREGGGGHAMDILRDVANTGLGTLSPAMRALFTAATGGPPFLTQSGGFLKTTQSRFDRDREISDRVKAALTAANPAVSAFAGQGGDVAGRSLGEALADENKIGGGLPSMAARVAEFLLPRVATVGVGGPNQALSAIQQAEREYQNAEQGYARRVLRANGPKEVEQVIAEAKSDAASRGLNTELIESALRKVAAGEGGRPARAERAAVKFYDRNPGAVQNPFQPESAVTGNPFH